MSKQFWLNYNLYLLTDVTGKQDYNQSMGFKDILNSSFYRQFVKDMYPSLEGNPITVIEMLASEEPDQEVSPNACRKQGPRPYRVVADMRETETLIFTSGDSTLVYKWSFPSPSPPPSTQRTIEQGSIETNELNMTLLSHMTLHDLVWLIMTHLTHYDSYVLVWLKWLVWLTVTHLYLL